jgi:large subunit ribosomal protein L18
MNTTSQKILSRNRRHARVRSRVNGTAARPRLAVFRSNRYVYAQLINDETQKTVTASDSRKVTGATMTERATAVGKAIADAAQKQGITTVVFDRGGFQYQGIIAALADGARAAGLVF